MVGTLSRAAKATVSSDEPFHLGAFLSRWHAVARHDLTASHSQTLSLAGLLALAKAEDRDRWERATLDYAAPRGAVPLRQAIAARYAGLDADDILCCAGAQEGMACVARTLLAPGDHAVVVLPIYQPLAWAVTDRADATGVPIGTENAALDLQRVADAIRPETRLVLMNVPNSPTGAVLDRSTQADLVELCRARGLWLVNDEVYRETVTDSARQPPPVAVAYERGVSIHALSKGFGLPGLRVGWVACQDRSLLARVATAKAVLSSCLAVPAEILAQIALREEAALIGQARSTGAANRRLLDAVIACHAGLFAPDPARNLAFAFPRYLGPDGPAAFAERLVQQTGTLLLPSNVWCSPLGPVPGGRLRVSLGQSAVPAGLEAMDGYLRRL